MSYVIIFRFGKVLIVQEVDSIDPLLLPVLRGDYIDQGKNKTVFPVELKGRARNTARAVCILVHSEKSNNKRRGKCPIKIPLAISS